MGVQSTMTISEKISSVAATIATALFTFPAAGEVRIATVLPAADLHRLAEVQRCIMYCLEYARDNNLYTSAVSIAVVTTLGDGKSGVREETVVANVVTDDVGILIVGTVRDDGGNLINYEAHKQLLDWLNENNRLVE